MAQRTFAAPTTYEFHEATRRALDAARTVDDACVQYVLQHVPVYIQPFPTPEQLRQSGARGKMLLGIWAPRWPGLETGPHGLIVLFEEGIRWSAENHGNALNTETLAVLLHEIQHALQRDHILQAVEKEQEAWGASARGYGYGASP